MKSTNIWSDGYQSQSKHKPTVSVELEVITVFG